MWQRAHKQKPADSKEKLWDKGRRGREEEEERRKRGGREGEREEESEGEEQQQQAQSFVVRDKVLLNDLFVPCIYCKYNPSLKSSSRQSGQQTAGSADRRSHMHRHTHTHTHTHTHQADLQFCIIKRTQMHEHTRTHTNSRPREKSGSDETTQSHYMLIPTV